MNANRRKPKLIVICGPTGIGKTSTAIEVARANNGEIIGADSMQIYRYMDIGTAKPTPEEQRRVTHHMIDAVDPDVQFDAAQFASLARQHVTQLHDKGIIPFVVGGTGLYIKSLLYGIYQSELVDPEVRSRLKKEATEHGIQWLFQRLKQCDPVTAQRLHPNDTYRIMRALETYEASGKSISEYQKSHGFSEHPYDVLKIGLNMDRKRLYERINRRVDKMIAAGFVDEVRKLLDLGYAAALKSMQSIGYRHMVDYIQGRLSWKECLRTMKRDHRRYAKRQLTWFGADTEIIWKEPKQLREIMKVVGEFLKGFSK
jgi:tRNA dimethylallyltransferase